MIVRIPLKLPSLNDYVKACRSNKFAGAQMKKDVQKEISVFLKSLPAFKRPVIIHFHWIEGNKRRDYDNIAFAKKFILDALVALGKLKDDNRKCVQGFKDTFSYGDMSEVFLKIDEAETKHFSLPKWIKEFLKRD